MAIAATDKSEQDLKRRVRRNALWLVALALAFYVGFILLAVRTSLG